MALVDLLARIGTDALVDYGGHGDTECSQYAYDST